MWRQGVLVPGGVLRYPGATTPRPRRAPPAPPPPRELTPAQRAARAAARAANPVPEHERLRPGAPFQSVLVSNPVLRQALLHLRMALPGVTDTAALQRLCDTYEQQREAIFAEPERRRGGRAAGMGVAAGAASGAGRSAAGAAAAPATGGAEAGGAGGVRDRRQRRHVPEVLFEASIGRQVADALQTSFTRVIELLRQPPLSRRKAEEKKRRKEELQAAIAEEEARAAAEAAAAPRTVADAVAEVAARPAGVTGRRVAGELGALMRQRAGGPTSGSGPTGPSYTVRVIRHR